MAMNPDGTGQRAIYGSNSYWPNALYYPRGIPGAPSKLVAIVAGYHGVPRMGELAILDFARGWFEADGIVQMIPGRDDPDTPIRDNLVDKSWPKFLHPYPLSDKYVIVACKPNRKATWGIWLADVFDQLVPLHVSTQHDLFEPIPLHATPRPPVLPSRVDMTRDDAVVFLHDVYSGPGLAGVPRGAVKRLRVFAYHFGYPGMAGPDKVGSGGPWEVMRILGTVPVDESGSAAFRVPANTPLSVQPLDADGKALQLMRSWFTAMPGETVSCVGCHDEPRDTPATVAETQRPVDIEPWYGPPRGFDFAREVQPVLDANCTRCHDGRSPAEGGATPDLRAEHLVKSYRGRQLAQLGKRRLHPAAREILGGTVVRYTPAYEALLPYIRRVGVEDEVHMLVPGEYHAGTSELIQMLEAGHHGVELDAEARDRLITWIDLNGPCHGTWGEVCPVPEGAAERRRELQRQYGGPPDDFEVVPTLARTSYRAAVEPADATAGSRRRPAPVSASGWPFDAAEAQRRQRDAGAEFTTTVDLGEGVEMELARIPAGEFVMGDSSRGDRARRVRVSGSFWIGVCEVTNAQYRRFDSAHRSGRFAKRLVGKDGPGPSLDDPRQPVVRVAWSRADEFCRWLSERTGKRFRLPTEEEWEYACRAGSRTRFHCGDASSDLAGYANVADRALARPRGASGGLATNASSEFDMDILCDLTIDDGVVASSHVGSFRPNAWGLRDMHGNASEWTSTAPTAVASIANTADDCRVVCGGSWRDRPERCRASLRLSYPAWQRVCNVGFRVVCEDNQELRPR